MKFGPRSIRGKTACIAVGVTAAAMALTVAAMAFAAQAAFVNSVSDTLESRVDEVVRQIQDGSLSSSISATGSDLVQVIDENGQVVSASEWAQGVSAMTQGGAPVGETSAHELDDLELKRTQEAQNVTVIEVHMDKEDDSEDDSKGDDDSAAEDASKSEPASDDAAEDAPAAAPQSAPASPAPANPTPAPANPAPAPAYDGDSGYGDGDSGYGDSGGDSGYDSAVGEGIAHFVGMLLSVASDIAAAVDDVELGVPRAWAADAAAQDAATEGTDAQPGQDAAGKTADEGAVPSVESSIRATDLFGNAGPFLMVERGVVTGEGTMTVAAMASLAPAYEAAKTAAVLLATAFAVLLVFVAVLSWMLAARTLRPVEQMRAAADSISIGDLSERIPVPEKDTDLSRLAGTFNAMLARLEASVAEQRRFVSDASHELKSPVAAIRIMLETMRDHPDAVDVNELLDDLMGENERVSGIVSDLLLLARQDEGVSRLNKEPIDICDLLYEEAALLKGRTTSEVDVSDVQPVVCSADHEALSHAVRNLMDNAARYAKTRVKVSCAQAGDAVRIAVSDDGKGIAPEDRERVFGRFVRLEEGRSRKEGSTGLGLAVVKTVAEQHGGTAMFVEPELGGATAVLEIPS